MSSSDLIAAIATAPGRGGVGVVRVSGAEVSALARSIKRSIAKTLKLQEGPVITYVEEAGAVNPFLIYGNEGTPCPRCGSPLAKMVLGGRGTVFCASCQK